MDLSRYDLIRPDIRAALRAYGTGEMPLVGGFLDAVLSNDLMEAVGRADSYNCETLPLIASYVYNELPSGCHGSREKVDAWQERCMAVRRARATGEEVDR